MVHPHKPAGWGMVILILLVSNLPLFFGTPNQALVFDASGVLRGEWWRLLTYPLAHVSLYHWVLDGATFLVLWGLWQAPGWGTRLATLAACSAGSLLGAMAWAPELWQVGLGGLSGVGHGLLAVVTLEQIAAAGPDRRARIIGILCLGALVAKSMIEAVTGSVVLSSLHPGELGIPIAACHLGGTLGGLAMSVPRERESWKIDHFLAAEGDAA